MTKTVMMKPTVANLMSQVREVFTRTTVCVFFHREKVVTPKSSRINPRTLLKSLFGQYQKNPPPARG